MKKIIGIAGSPRRNGNSNTLMRRVLEAAAAKGAKEEEIILNELTFRGCQGCTNCLGGGGCIVKDELTPVLAKLHHADIWVLASPIYYDGATGQLKSFFDRCRTFTRDAATRELKPQLSRSRRGAIVFTYADSPRDDYARLADIFAGYLGWMGDFGIVQKLACGNLTGIGEVNNHPELLKRAAEIGEILVSG